MRSRFSFERKSKHKKVVFPDISFCKKLLTAPRHRIAHPHPHPALWAWAWSSIDTTHYRTFFSAHIKVRISMIFL
jgi:hypothetical protein